jgi:hypothetical protein
MTNFLDLAMLICASIGAMAFGVLAAFLTLRVVFWLMRPSLRSAAPVEPQPEVARIS